MKCGFLEDAEEFGICSGIDKANTDFFRGETGGSDQRSVAVAVPLKIEISTGADKRVDQRQLGAAFQFALEEHVADEVEGMGEILLIPAPADEHVGTRWIFGQKSAEGLGIAIANCRFYVHRLLLLRMTPDIVLPASRSYLRL